MLSSNFWYQEEYTELLKYTVNSVTLTEDGLEPENSLVLGGPVTESGVNLNNNEMASKNDLHPDTAGSPSHRTSAGM